MLIYVHSFIHAGNQLLLSQTEEQICVSSFSHIFSQIKSAVFSFVHNWEYE